MSIEILKQQIEKFLNSEIPEVMTIRGTWGVGKTYSWNKFLKDAKDNNKISFNNYSYVSLFGINSIDTLKFNIFQQIIDKKIIGTEPNLKSFKENADSIFKSLGRKASSLLHGLPWIKDFTPNILSLSFLSINETIICIDDFERKGNNLSTKDIMGLISILKEQKNCKVVIIFNDEELEGINKVEYKKYREKVIDSEIEFKPTPEESVEIALKTDATGKMLRDFIIKLGISNIRIIKKIEKLALQIVPLIEKYDSKICYQSLHTLCLFTWCFYSTKDSPNYDFVKKQTYFAGMMDDKLSDEEKLWTSKLSHYGYSNTDEFDLEIANIVEKGYINENDLINSASKLNTQIRAIKSENDFHEAWNLYHRSFDNNQEEVINKLYDSFKENVKYISPTNLDSTVNLFRQLERNDLADEIIEYYCTENKDDRSKFDLDKYRDILEIKDVKVKEKIKDISKTFVVERTIKQVLEKIAGKDSWGGEDERILSNATPDDYYNLFKTEKGSHLTPFVNTCLRFGKLKNADEQAKKIANNATIALKKIASESLINKLRVKKFGITLEDNA